MNNNTRIKTILILAANPTSTSRLRLDEEVREIDEGLRRANKREEFKLEQKWAVRSRDFYRAMLDYQPQIVHFCGHGAGQDGILLEDETGQPALRSADALGSMFKLFATKGVDCVLIVTCSPLKLTTTGGDFGCSNLNCFGIERELGWIILYNCWNPCHI